MSYDDDAQVKLKSAKRKLTFFNLLIVATAVTCALCLILTNFWSFKFGFEPTPEFIRSLVPEHGAGDLDYEEMFKDVKISLEVKIAPDGFVKSVFVKGSDGLTKNEERVKAVFTPAYDAFASQTKNLFTQVLKIALRIVRAQAVNEIVEEMEAAAGEVGKIEVTEGLNNLIDGIMEGGTDKDDAKDKIMDFMLIKLNEKMNPGDPGYDEAKLAIENEVNNVVGSMLDKIVNEENIIVPEIMIYNALGKMLGLGDNFDPDVFMTEMSKKLAENKIVLYVVWGLILFWGIPIVLWGLLGLFALLRLLMKRKGVGLSMKLAKTICFIPGLLIWLVPTLAVLFAPRVIADKLPAGVLDGIKVTFGATGPIISAVGVIVLIILGILGYNKARRTAKRLTD